MTLLSGARGRVQRAPAPHRRRRGSRSIGRHRSAVFVRPESPCRQWVENAGLASRFLSPSGVDEPSRSVLVGPGQDGRFNSGYLGRRRRVSLVE